MTTKKKLMMRIITTPYKAVCKAKDLYIRSITSCANHTTYGGSAITFGTQLPRTTSSSSFASNDEDLRELIRANSTARMADLNINRGDLDLYIKQHMMIMKQSSPAMASRRVPRSASVGMGRIDEDAPVEDEDDMDMGRKVKSDHLMFPRSKSHAVTTRISADAKINRFS